MEKDRVEMLSLNLNEIYSVEGARCLPTATNKMNHTIETNNTRTTKTTEQNSNQPELHIVEVLKQLILFFQRLHVHKTEVSTVFALHQ